MNSRNYRNIQKSSYGEEDIEVNPISKPILSTNPNSSHLINDPNHLYHLKSLQPIMKTQIKSGNGLGRTQNRNNVRIVF
jgi:hypothetical protein